jgi:hypothetical protein
VKHSAFEQDFTHGRLVALGGVRSPIIIDVKAVLRGTSQAGPTYWQL